VWSVWSTVSLVYSLITPWTVDSLAVRYIMYQSQQHGTYFNQCYEENYIVIVVNVYYSVTALFYSLKLKEACVFGLW